MDYDEVIMVMTYQYYNNVCSAEKVTKRSSVILLRLVAFFLEQTLQCLVHGQDSWLLGNKLLKIYIIHKLGR